MLSLSTLLGVVLVMGLVRLVENAFSPPDDQLLRGKDAAQKVTDGAITHRDHNPLQRVRNPHARAELLGTVVGTRHGSSTAADLVAAQRQRRAAEPAVLAADSHNTTVALDQQ